MAKIDRPRIGMAVLALLAAALFVFLLFRLSGHLAPGLLRPLLWGPSSLLCVYRCLGFGPFRPLLDEMGKALLWLFVSGAALAAVLRLFRKMGKTRRFINHIQRRAVSSPIFVEGHEILVFKDRLPLAFTGGLLKPRIYLSTSLRDSLNEEELRAVVLHESCHLKAKDPLKALLVSFLCDLYFFLPVAPFLKMGQRLLAEMRADAQSLSTHGHASALARALVKVQNLPDPSCSGFNDLRRERTKHLCGERAKILPPAGKIVLSAALLVLLVFLSLRPSPRDASRAFALHQKSCPRQALHKKREISEGAQDEKNRSLFIVAGVQHVPRRPGKNLPAGGPGPDGSGEKP